MVQQKTHFKLIPHSILLSHIRKLNDSLVSKLCSIIYRIECNQVTYCGVLHRRHYKVFIYRAWHSGFSLLVGQQHLCEFGTSNQLNLNRALRQKFCLSWLKFDLSRTIRLALMSSPDLFYSSQQNPSPCPLASVSRHLKVPIITDLWDAEVSNLAK